ncbi:hypothetical protein SK128_010254 [Halocaridina rubra]|uniref:VOC domain-containing protein n=1 Tax=Halocaridina rubra TaxID=373956 RepID=A0AAN8WZM4_HALRR
MSCSVLHHVEVCVKDNRFLHLLTKGFGFAPFAHRITSASTKLALRSGTSVFVVVKRNSEENNQHGQNGTEITKDVMNGCSNGYTNGTTELACESIYPRSSWLQSEREHWTVFCCEKTSRHIRDSVFNVALTVKDIDTVTERVKSHGGRVIKEPTEISDAEGRVRYSVVSSCLGNIVHTLIDKKHYKGTFLPGFESIEKHDEISIVLESITNLFKKDSRTNTNGGCELLSKDNLKTQTPDFMVANCLKSPNSLNIPRSTFIDHVTYVCEIGKSSEILSWYEKCFGMKRFKTNKDESENEGFVLRENIGLRLKAMEYWRCAETFLAAPDANNEDKSLKLVIAEPLPGVSTSHVQAFLKAHGGPGIQHIGLHTPTMVATVDFMAKNGVIFRKAPPVYYEEGIKLEEIQDAGHSEEVDLFKELGILLDTEADAFSEDGDKQNNKSYLMQVFTGPLFDEDTFFLEVIQRKGAKGFGAGNIVALAKSIIIHNQKMNG